MRFRTFDLALFCLALSACETGGPRRRDSIASDHAPSATATAGTTTVTSALSNGAQALCQELPAL